MGNFEQTEQMIQEAISLSRRNNVSVDFALAAMQGQRRAESSKMIKEKLLFVSDLLINFITKQTESAGKEMPIDEDDLPFED